MCDPCGRTASRGRSQREERLIRILTATLGVMALTTLPVTAYTSIGMGSDTCETWTADRSARGVGAHGADALQDQQWVLGYLSAVPDWDPGHLDPVDGIDSAGVWAWMDDYCGAHSLVTIKDAAIAFVRQHPGK